ncbi:SUMO-interacting motif-containing protein 1 [Oryzias melastigma]|uniref:SUMO interacting motifs containing 1 n=1 Tax=Oryzias melastigma TaxID=30732 RepID=A0A3B3BFR1_ORYME|nr:SUMO-interacting motif-containing protein 1 [Oryzias melastigma]XP_024139653.1 SUMO-interacting motif-containing protein 1 [Oryzias melastigma]
MEDVISLSSDDSDVEIVSSFSAFSAKLPLSEVRVDLDAKNVSIPPQYIDLTDPRWSFPKLKLCSREYSTDRPVIDLTASDANEIYVDTENLSPKHDDLPGDKDDCEILKADVCNLLKRPSKDCSVFTPHAAKQRRLNSPSQQHEEQKSLCPETPVVKLKDLPFPELKTSSLSVRLDSPSEMSLSSTELNSKDEAEICVDNLRETTAAVHEEKTEGLAQLVDNEAQKLQGSVDYSSAGEENSTATIGEQNTNEDGFLSSNCNPSPNSTPSSQDERQREPLSSNLKQAGSENTQSSQSSSFSVSSPHSLIIAFNSRESLESSSPVSDCGSQNDQVLICGDEPNAKTPEWELETEKYGDVGPDSPVSFLWQEESEEEESRCDADLTAVSRADRNYVCPKFLRKVMARRGHFSIDDENESLEIPEVLCRQSLCLVYSTIDECYPESTLQLLSDLLQPGYYPPKDIMVHLLRGILLDTQGPYYLCVQAFNLLMRTQRHHIATKSTVPWDWELLSSVMSNQDQRKELRGEVVCMVLEYIVQTLEDDFYLKPSPTSLNYSLAKASLSCDRQFPRVRDVIKWLFSAIVNSTDCGENEEAARKRDEQMRIVSMLQRMLSLALEVDRSPALSSAKLAQELFLMLLSDAPLRAHRMLLLDSLQSKLLRCKLLELLLDYACPKKLAVPMSLTLLLHFMKNCTLAPDPTDGTERWLKWEELIHLLWMLLLSYNKAMKGYLSSFYRNQKDKARPPVYKPHDMVSKAAVREAVEAFLSRSQADLDQALPLHVEESLTYLQDYLLDICQS